MVLGIFSKKIFLGMFVKIDGSSFVGFNKLIFPQKQSFGTFRDFLQIRKYILTKLLFDLKINQFAP